MLHVRIDSFTGMLDDEVLPYMDVSPSILLPFHRQGAQMAVTGLREYLVKMNFVQVSNVITRFLM